MAFTSHFHSNYNFLNGFSEFAPASSGGLAMWYEENLPLVDNIISGMVDYSYMVPSESDMTSCSSISTKSFPREFDNTWNMQPVVPEMNVGYVVENQAERCEFGEECSGFGSNFWAQQYSTAAAATNSWEIKSEQLGIQESTEEHTMKIGRYSAEERKDRILRYLKKRNQRNFNKTIKYACRKTLADKRVRVRGRFAKNNEASSSSSDHDENVAKNNNSLQQDAFKTDFFQIKHDEDEWLDVVTSFMYLPYING